MRLYEFTKSDPITSALIAVTAHLKAKYLESRSTEPMSTDAFIAILRRNGVSVSKEQLRELSKSEPLSNLISNMNDYSVFFVDRPEEKLDAMNDDSEDTFSKETVERLANRAANISN